MMRIQQLAACLLLTAAMGCRSDPATDAVSRDGGSVVAAAAPVAEASGMVPAVPAESIPVDEIKVEERGKEETEPGELASPAQLRASFKTIEGQIPTRDELESSLLEPQNALEVLLADADPQVRANATIALGYWSDDTAIRELLVRRALDGRLAPHDRLAALTALEGAEEEAGRFLSALLSAEQPPEVQTGVARLLVRSPTYRDFVRAFLDSGGAHPAAARVAGQLLADHERATAPTGQ